jgi:hypothetical protein
MRLRHLAVCASLLAVAACDGPDTNPILPDAGPKLANGAPEWTLYTTQLPDQELDATGGWEVGSRFRSSKPGRIIGFRFYRAENETGTNYGRLWSNTGTKLKTSNAFPPGTGWVTVMLDNPVTITAGTTYRVSVNTNTRQAKRGGGYAYDGPLGTGPLYSDGGYYRQGAGLFPNTSSASYFFADVIFEETVVQPKPDLYVSSIDASDLQNVKITVCNKGNANAGTSYTRLFHLVASYPGAPDARWQTTMDLWTDTIAAGACRTVQYPSPTNIYLYNEYHTTADSYNHVAESDENNNTYVLRPQQ